MDVESVGSEVSGEIEGGAFRVRMPLHRARESPVAVRVRLPRVAQEPWVWMAVRVRMLSRAGGPEVDGGPDAAVVEGVRAL